MSKSNTASRAPTHEQSGTTPRDGIQQEALLPVNERPEIDQKQLSDLINFFNLLEKWDRETNHHGKVV